MPALALHTYNTMLSIVYFGNGSYKTRLCNLGLGQGSTGFYFYQPLADLSASDKLRISSKTIRVSFPKTGNPFLTRWRGAPSRVKWSR